VEEEEELDDDYSPDGQDDEEYEDGMDAMAQFEPGEGIDPSGVIDDDEVDGIIEDEFEEGEEEDGDEEMQDRGMKPLTPSQQPGLLSATIGIP
jgi:hypothetical protein